MLTRDYKYYKKIFEGHSKPLAFIDIDLLNENIGQIVRRAKGKNIRIASKSIRAVAILKFILDKGKPFNGLMCFSPYEMAWLAGQGFDNLLAGYPAVDERQIAAVAQQVHAGKQLTLMVDCEDHVNRIDRIAGQAGVVIPLCMDIDMSMDLPGLHFGVWRSGIRTVEQALSLARFIAKKKNVKLTGIMGYEAQIAGVGDIMPGKPWLNPVIRILKSKSAQQVASKRKAIVEALKAEGFNLEFVNGGGTGSMETTCSEESVTEVTVGSGFYSPSLFDYYRNFRHLPAAAFALEIVRIPAKNIYTCSGGGYIASGAPGVEKLPAPYLPAGIKLDNNEGAGEVQTPCHYSGEIPLAIGDPIFFRHSKAGELCERFDMLYLVSNGKIIDRINTYRGDGKCFL